MIVLDSSVLIAYHDLDDVHHAKAMAAVRAVADGAWGKALLLEYVFLETVTILKRKRSVLLALEAGKFMRRSFQFDFLPCSDIFQSAWQEFQSDFMSPLSFVDTAIVAVARQRAGGKVLTFDKAFRSLPGITALPQ